MKKFVLLTLVVWFMLAFFITTTYGKPVTSLMPLSLRTIKVDTCQLPCWIDIHPGKTSVDEARTLIKRAFPVTSSGSAAYDFETKNTRLIAPNLYERQSIVSRRIQSDHTASYDLNYFMIVFPETAKPTTFNVEIFSRNGIVQQIGFSFDPTLNVFPPFTPTLREVVNSFGLPTCVAYYSGSGIEILSLNYLNTSGDNYREFQFSIRNSRLAIDNPLNPPLQNFRSNDKASCPYPEWLNMVLAARYLLGQ